MIILKKIALTYSLKNSLIVIDHQALTRNTVLILKLMLNRGGHLYS